MRQRKLPSSEPNAAAGRAIGLAVPRPELLFEPAHDRYGARLALVFGNHAAGGVCPYYAANRCFHCDIGTGEGAALDQGANRQRLAWLGDHYQQALASIVHLVIYNSGSVLNPREMPPELLDEIIAFARALPAVRVVSLDSRENFIRADALRRMLAGRAGGLMIRPVLGIETIDDRLRNQLLEKGMPRSAIARVYHDLGAVAAEMGPGLVGLDVNVVVGGPGTTLETAVEDAVATARFALDAGVEHGVSVDLNLHPYYPGTRGSARFPGHGRCPPATTARAAAEIATLVRSMAVESCIFIGCHDEGHDRDQVERDAEMARARGAFERFNRTNEPGLLLSDHLRFTMRNFE
jgi:hypothetical protein